MIDYAAAIAYLRPGEEWTLDGNEYAGLTWLSDTTKPTDAQLIAAWPKAQEAQAAAAAAAAKNAAHAPRPGEHALPETRSGQRRHQGR